MLAFSGCLMVNKQKDADLLVPSSAHLDRVQRNPCGRRRRTPEGMKALLATSLAATAARKTSSKTYLHVNLPGKPCLPAAVEVVKRLGWRHISDPATRAALFSSCRAQPAKRGGVTRTVGRLHWSH